MKAKLTLDEILTEEVLAAAQGYVEGLGAIKVALQPLLAYVDELEASRGRLRAILRAVVVEGRSEEVWEYWRKGIVMLGTLEPGDLGETPCDEQR